MHKAERTVKEQKDALELETVWQETAEDHLGAAYGPVTPLSSNERFCCSWSIGVLQDKQGGTA